jgi:hypothetical protein
MGLISTEPCFMRAVEYILLDCKRNEIIRQLEIPSIKNYKTNQKKLGRTG